MRWTGKIKKLNKIVRLVKSYGERMSELSDADLSHLTADFRERLEQGESLDDLLPEAFAAICEADYRVLGMMPYDVQILGGIVLFPVSAFRYKGMVAARVLPSSV